MESRAHAIAAGIFTLVLAIALISSVWWLTGNREAAQAVLLVAGGSVNGLNTQAQVRFRGLRVGKVESIAIDPAPPYRMLVRVNVARTVPITSHTTAQVNTQGVTGLSFIQMDDDGAGTLLVGGSGSIPRLDLRPSSLDGMGAAAVDLAAQVKNLTGRLTLLVNERNLGHIERTLGHLESATAGMDKTLKELPRLLADAHRLLNDENLKRFAATLSNLERASADGPALVADARRALEGLQGTSKRLDALGADLGGEVSQTTLPRLNRLLQDLALNSRQLARVLEQVERAPQSLLFGRDGQRPEPGEPGFKGEK